MQYLHSGPRLKASSSSGLTLSEHSNVQVIQHDIKLKEMTPAGFSAEWSQQVLQLAQGKSKNRPANRVAAMEFAAPCRATYARSLSASR